MMLRWFWLLYTGFVWVLWLASLPTFLEQAAAGTLPTVASNGTAVAQLASESAAIWGVSLTTWAWINTAVTALSTLVFTGVGLLIWWRVRTGFGLLTAYMLMLGTAYMDTALLSANYPPMVVALLQIGAGFWPLMWPWLFLFPNGRAVPHRFLWVLGPMFVLFAGMQWLYTVTLYLPQGHPLSQTIAPLQPVQDMMVLVMMLLTLGAQVYRYMKVSSQVEKQQVRWFLLGFALFVLPVLPLTLLQIRYPLELDILTFAALPLGIGVSVLRYRLWDIDVIVRKTLVYAVLSGLLALVYFGIVVLLQSVFDAVSGQQSPVAIVISTLVIAALFTPLRQRVQALIDRRFFRKKYDAQQVLAQFTQTARDEVSLEAITAELTSIVQGTMQPENVSIWVKTAKDNQLT